MATMGVLFRTPDSSAVGSMSRRIAGPGRRDRGRSSPSRKPSAPVRSTPAATTNSDPMATTAGLAKPANASAGPTTPATRSSPSVPSRTMSVRAAPRTSAPTMTASAARVYQACQVIGGSGGEGKAARGGPGSHEASAERLALRPVPHVS